MQYLAADMGVPVSKVWESIEVSERLVLGRSSWQDEFREEVPPQRGDFERTTARGQFTQVHGDLQGFELHLERCPGKCHGIQSRVRRRRASSDVDSGTATSVYRHRDIPVLISIAQRCGLRCESVRASRESVNSLGQESNSQAVK